MSSFRRNQEIWWKSRVFVGFGGGSELKIIHNLNDWEYKNVETRSEDCEDSDAGDVQMSLIYVCL